MAREEGRCWGAVANSKWAFVKFFWRLALNGSLKGDTRTCMRVHIGGCKGWQERRASESTAGRRIRTAERKRRWPEWWEVLGFFVLFFFSC